MREQWLPTSGTIAFATLCWAAATGTAGAASIGPILSEGPIVISAVSSANALEELDVRDFFPGTPGLAATLLEPSFLARFPTSQSTLPGGFVSSLMTTDRFAGVGASGWSSRRSTSSAVAGFSQTIENIGDAPAPLVLTYTIPEILVATLAGSSVYGPEAIARAEMIATYFGADGAIRGQETVFRYSIQLVKDRFGAGIDGHYWDLIGLQQGHFVEQGDVFGIRHSEIKDSAPLDLLDAGERVHIDYELFAWGTTGDTPEVGYHALIGDPFNIGSGGFSVSLGPAGAAVPEPATGLLFPIGLGLLGMSFALRRKRPQHSGAARNQ